MTLLPFPKPPKKPLFYISTKIKPHNQFSPSNLTKITLLSVPSDQLIHNPTQKQQMPPTILQIQHTINLKNNKLTKMAYIKIHKPKGKNWQEIKPYNFSPTMKQNKNTNKLKIKTLYEN